MLTRRELLKRATRAGIAAALMPAACTVPAPEPDGVWVNDVHSQLNRTRVLGIERPTNIEALKALVIRAGNQERSISVMGGPSRHGRTTVRQRHLPHRYEWHAGYPRV